MRKTNNKFIMLGLALLSSACLSLSAVSAEKEAPKRMITLQKTGTRVKPFRPKAPDRQIVTCSYDGEELYISFVIPEGMATLSVTDENALNASYQFDTSPLETTITVGPLQGTIYIEMETERGNVYQGEIE